MRTPDKEYFLKQVSDDGTPIGNKSLREQLKWDEEKYWRIRDELLEDGLITKAKGKGGAVLKVEQTAHKDGKASVILNELYKNEKSLYAPFKKTIETQFTKDWSIKSFVCEDVSAQGGRTTGGLWTRPDIILVSVQSYTFFPGKVLDLISFEIKHYQNISVAGVYETAAHSKFANRSFYCLYTPQGVEQIDDLERIKSDSEQFHVGLLYFTDPQDYDTFEILVDPIRRDPDPAEMDEFIRVQLKENVKEKLLSFLR